MVKRDDKTKEGETDGTSAANSCERLLENFAAAVEQCTQDPKTL